MKTGCVALVLCLNISVDPPDVIKISPCARMECWIGIFSFLFVAFFFLSFVCYKISLYYISLINLLVRFQQQPSHNEIFLHRNPKSILWFSLITFCKFMRFMSINLVCRDSVALQRSFIQIHGSRMMCLITVFKMTGKMLLTFKREKYLTSYFFYLPCFDVLCCQFNCWFF